METKNFLKSKTIWFNAVSIGLMIATFLSSDTLNAYGVSHQAQAKILPVIGLLVGIGNWYLRSITTQGLSITSPPTSGQKT